MVHIYSTYTHVKHVCISRRIQSLLLHFICDIIRMYSSTKRLSPAINISISQGTVWTSEVPHQHRPVERSRGQLPSSRVIIEAHHRIYIYVYVHVIYKWRYYNSCREMGVPSCPSSVIGLLL